METEVQRIAAAQRARWEAMSVEVTDRGTPRLPQFKKDFSNSDLTVMQFDKDSREKVPFLLRSGRPLKASECLPDHADLCLDEEACLVDQSEFERRYGIYLQSYVMPSTSDPHFEPIPNVAEFLNQKPDTHSASRRGMVEIDFEPGSADDFKVKFYVDEQGNSIPVEEYERQQNEKERRDERLEKLLVLLAENQIGSDKLAAVSVDESGEATVTDIEVDTPPKKRRGRPPKNPRPEGDEAA